MSLEAAVEQIVGIVQSYGLKKVYGDRYAGRLYVEMFERHGIDFQHPIVREIKELHPLKDSDKKADIQEVYLDRSAIYLEAEALFASGRIQTLDHPKLVTELGAPSFTGWEGSHRPSARPARRLQQQFVLGGRDGSWRRRSAEASRWHTTESAWTLRRCGGRRSAHDLGARREGVRPTTRRQGKTLYTCQGFLA